MPTSLTMDAIDESDVALPAAAATLLAPVCRVQAVQVVADKVDIADIVDHVLDTIDESESNNCSAQDVGA
jgi:hypothetical protein